MIDLSMNDKLVLVQYAINKYETENVLQEKLKDVLSAKEVERILDTLIGTQKVRRIGTDILQNNTSHVGELPDIPEYLKIIIDKL